MQMKNFTTIERFLSVSDINIMGFHFNHRSFSKLTAGDFLYYIKSGKFSNYQRAIPFCTFYLKERMKPIPPTTLTCQKRSLKAILHFRKTRIVEPASTFTPGSGA